MGTPLTSALTVKIETTPVAHGRSIGRHLIGKTFGEIDSAQIATPANESGRDALWNWPLVSTNAIGANPVTVTEPDAAKFPQRFDLAVAR